MAIEPNIALGVRPLELPNQLAQYGQVAQIQNAQNQNALAQYQLGAAQRAEAKDIARTNALSKAGTDDTAIADALLKSGDLAGYTSFLKTRREAQKADIELVDAKLGQSRKFLEGIADPFENPTLAAQQYISWHEANHKDPILGPALAARGSKAEDSRARIMDAVEKGPTALATAIYESKLGTEKFTEMNKAQLSTKDIGGSIVDRTFNPLTRQIKEIDTTAKTATPGDLLTNARAKENIAISREKLKRDSDPAFQQQMAAAKATGEAIAKNDVAAKQALPGIITNAQTALDVIDQMVGKQEVRDKNGKLIQAATKPHPGFENAVGATWVPGARFVPGTDAAGFQALQDQIEGTAFLSAFEALKGGGSISEKEGAKATAARLRMTLAQDEKEYVKAAREFQEIVRTGVQNAQRKAGGAAPSGSPNIDAILDKYK
jgi:hypothetical protein